MRPRKIYKGDNVVSAKNGHTDGSTKSAFKCLEAGAGWGVHEIRTTWVNLNTEDRQSVTSPPKVVIVEDGLHLPMLMLWSHIVPKGAQEVHDSLPF